MHTQQSCVVMQVHFSRWLLFSHLEVHLALSSSACDCCHDMMNNVANHSPLLEIMHCRNSVLWPQLYIQLRMHGYLVT